MLISDGLTFRGQRVEHASIHAQTLAELAGFQPGNSYQRFQKVLLPFIRGEEVPEVNPSAYWISYVFEVPHVLANLKLFYIWIPIVFLVFCLFAISGYPPTRKKMVKIRAELENRRGAI